MQHLAYRMNTSGNSKVCKNIQHGPPIDVIIRFGDINLQTTIVYVPWLIKISN